MNPTALCLQALCLAPPARWFSHQTAVPVCSSRSVMLGASAKPSYATLKSARWRRRNKRSKSKVLDGLTGGCGPAHVLLTATRCSSKSHAIKAEHDQTLVSIQPRVYTVCHVRMRASLCSSLMLIMTVRGPVTSVLRHLILKGCLSYSCILSIFALISGWQGRSWPSISFFLRCFEQITEKNSLAIIICFTLKCGTGEWVKPFSVPITNNNKKKIVWLFCNFPFFFFCFSAVGVASSGGDFMSDLFNKLAMRRKGESCPLKKDLRKILTSDKSFMTYSLLSAGISGKGPAGGEPSDAPSGTGGAFARMSDVIPPMPAPHSTTDDEDWEA